MSRKRVGIVDYGAGNHASLVHSFRGLGFLPFTSTDPELLEETDVVVLPGVGAFPTAMDHLHSQGLVTFLRAWAEADRPLIGICLGMQLMGDSSEEMGDTNGLGIIPGRTAPLRGDTWNIGWDDLSVAAPAVTTWDLAGDYYFNHSFEFLGADEFVTAVSRKSAPIQAVVRKGNAVGLQFHPEKSQDSGKRLLSQLVGELING